jgi:hypothetical protein
MVPHAANLLDLSRRSDASGFLKAIFDGLICDGFRFPVSGADGCIGNCCISKAQVVAIPGTAKKVALHLNFTCVPGGFGNGSLNLAISHFHLTARPAAGQSLINVAGPSILTAGESIHINRNGDWGRAPNITQLARVLNVTEQAILTQLRNFEGYTTAYMSHAVTQLKDAIVRTVGVNAGHTLITWHNSDATFA